MKSKTFYSKFAKASFVKQLWIMGMTAFAYFVFMLVPLVIDLNNWTDASYTFENVKVNYASFMVQSDASYILIIILGVLIAICQFAYLIPDASRIFMAVWLFERKRCIYRR